MKSSSGSFQPLKTRHFEPKMMRYAIVVVVTVLFAGLIYASHWAAEARMAKIKSDAGLGENEHVDLKVPARLQTWLELEQLVFDLRFALVPIVLVCGLLGAAMLGNKQPRPGG